MPDTLTAAPEQGTIQQPLSPTGESILGSIFNAPVRPEEVKQGTDLKELKKELGDKFQDKPSTEPEKPAEKTPEQEEKEFTEKFLKKDDDTEVIEPKDDPKKEEKKEDVAKGDQPKEKTTEKSDQSTGKTSQSEDEDEVEAKGKIKNIGDARKLWKEHKKLKKEHGEKLSAKETELKEAREELQKLKDAPKPDSDAIAAQEKELAELRAERQYIKEQAEAIEQRAAAVDIQSTEPYKRLVMKPLERMGGDLEELASAVSDDKADQETFMAAVGRALSIEDPKQRRKAIEEVGAPLTSMQQAELIQLGKDHQRVMADKGKLLGDSQTALKIIKEKQEIDRREWTAKNSGEFKAGALEARAEMKKMYKFFERTDLPDDVKAQITELETAVDSIDPGKLPAKEVGKIVEAYYRGKILNDAASKHIAHMEKAEKEYKAKLDAALKELEEIKGAKEKATADAKSKEEGVDGARPNLDTGNTNTDTPQKVDTIEGMVSNLFRV